MKPGRTRTTLLLTALVSCTAIATAACGPDPNQVPIPGTGVRGGYAVVFEFASAMNLPDRAHVTMDGIRIGEVRSMRLTGGSVAVTAQISGGTRIPADITAAIRQNTLLGDTYVALERDGSHHSTAVLDPGAVVPLARTVSPPQLEDVMAVLSNFINGGSVQKIQDAIVRINTVMPPAPDVDRLATTVSTDLQDLSRQTDELDRFLAQLNNTAVSVDENSQALSVMFSDSGVTYWRHLNDNVLRYVGTVLPSIGSIFEGGIWLVPMLESLASAAASVRSTAEDVPGDAAALSDFINRILVPFLRNPSVNVGSIRAADGTDLTPGIGNILRMLGVAR
ncbi:MlaD family protein [Nocardia nepalensis]|uniref:MlaD family protein n=1 Tax=Nocardia nepalensis TaxID=3375448 RepID=UPI003B66C372